MSWEIRESENGFIVLEGLDMRGSAFERRTWVAKDAVELGQLIKELVSNALNGRIQRKKNE